MSLKFEDLAVPETVELWGEFKIDPELPTVAPSIHEQLDISELIKAGLVNKPLEQPVVMKQNTDSVVVGIDNGRTIDLIKHTIKLHQHGKIMEKNLRDIERVADPKFQKYPESPQMIHSRKEDAKKEIDPAVLSAENIHEILELSVITILAHVGFEKTRRSVILTLVDVIKGFIKRLCRITQLLAERDVIDGKLGYKVVMDKAFKAIGYSGLDCLKDYVKRSIIDQHKAASDRSAGFVELYKKKAENLSLAQNIASSQGVETLFDALVVPKNEYVDSGAGPSGVVRVLKRKKPASSSGPLRSAKDFKREP